MGKPYRPHSQFDGCVYMPTLEELKNERNELIRANENGGLVVESLCATIREQKEEINGHKAEIRRLRAEVGERDRLIEKISLKKEKEDK